MDLKELRSFVHVAELGSLVRAADRLGVSQPALSRHVRILEEELGVRLLRRTGRGVVPTDSGEIVARHAREVLDHVARMSDEVAARRAAVTGRLAFGLPPSVGVSVTGPLVEAYRAAYGAVALQVIEDLSGAIQDRLLTGELDLAILYEGATSASLATRQVFTEELWLVGAEGKGLAEEPIAFEAVSAYPLILPGRRHGLRAVIEQHAFRHAVPLRTDIEVDSLRAQLDLVRRGLGYTILPRTTFQVGNNSEGLVAVAIADPPLLRSWVLAWPRDRSLGRPAAALSELLLAHIPQWVPSDMREPQS